MLFHRCAGTISVAVEKEQSLRELSVVQSFLEEHVLDDFLVLSVLNEILNGLSFVFAAGGVECVVEGEILQSVKELLLEGRRWRVVVGIYKGKHILEHARGSTRSGYELHDFVSLRLVLVPRLDVSLLVVLAGGDDTVFDTGSGFQSQEWESRFELAELLLDLLFTDTLLGNLLEVLLC